MNPPDYIECICEDSPRHISIRTRYIRAHRNCQFSQTIRSIFSEVQPISAHADLSVLNELFWKVPLAPLITLKTKIKLVPGAGLYVMTCEELIDYFKELSKEAAS